MKKLLTSVALERYFAIALVLATLISIGALGIYQWSTACRDCPTVTVEQYRRALQQQQSERRKESHGY